MYKLNRSSCHYKTKLHNNLNCSFFLQILNLSHSLYSRHRVSAAMCIDSSFVLLVYYVYIYVCARESERNREKIKSL